MDKIDILIISLKVITELLKVIDSHLPDDARIIDCKCKDKIDLARKTVQEFKKELKYQ